MKIEFAYVTILIPIINRNSKTVMVNNSRNINKTNNYLLPHMALVIQVQISNAFISKILLKCSTLRIKLNHVKRILGVMVSVLASSAVDR